MKRKQFFHANEVGGLPSPAAMILRVGSLLVDRKIPLRTVVGDKVATDVHSLEMEHQTRQW